MRNDEDDDYYLSDSAVKEFIHRLSVLKGCVDRVC